LANQDKQNLNINGREWITTASMYGFCFRMSTAYNHKGFWKFQGHGAVKYTEDGTFLKSLALLPHLKKLGFDTLVSLPINKCSNYGLYGELPSPYAVKDLSLIHI